MDINKWHFLNSCSKKIRNWLKANTAVFVVYYSATLRKCVPFTYWTSWTAASSFPPAGTLSAGFHAGNVWTPPVSATFAREDVPANTTRGGKTLRDAQKTHNQILKLMSKCTFETECEGPIADLWFNGCNWSADQSWTNISYKSTPLFKACMWYFFKQSLQQQSWMRKWPL